MAQSQLFLPIAGASANDTGYDLRVIEDTGDKTQETIGLSGLKQESIMGGVIYVIQSDSKLIELREEAYGSEDLLQHLLAKYSNLLAGEQIDSDHPRRWILVSREMGIPDTDQGINRWSVDHLFIDQDAIPTLVEVKRSSDTRLRREVIGQMLEYAANAVTYWPIETIRAQFEVSCTADNTEPESRLRELLGDQTEPEEFWQKANVNLKTGRIRMLFVADQIPTELRRVIEFLNEQMEYAEVLGIEIKQYVGGGIQSLVPRVLGQTVGAQDRKAVASRVKRQWDEESFLAELEARRSAQDAEVAKSILQWAHEHGLRIIGGKGWRDGTLYPILDIDGDEFTPISLLTFGGQIVIQFGIIMQFPPFDQEAKRLELRDYLNQIPGVDISLDRLSKYPFLRFTDLIDKKALSQFTESLDWALKEVRSAYES